VLATEVFHTLKRLVRKSPFLKQDDEGKRLMLTQFAGSYAKKQEMLLEWRITPDKLA
jgi:hypothetical protein